MNNTTIANNANGAAWAAVIAAGIGCAAFGLVVDLSEAVPAISRALNFYDPTGDLSGKSTVAIAFWISAWCFFHFRWKLRNMIHTKRILIVSTLLVAISMLAVFPPVMELFSRK